MESLAVEEVMRANIAKLTPNATLEQVREALKVDEALGVQRLFPVEDPNGNMVGVIPRWNLEQFAAGNRGSSLGSLIVGNPTIAYGDERLTAVVQRIASTGLTKMPVVKRSEPGKVIGIVSLTDLMKARLAAQDTEQLRERVLHLSVPLLFRGRDEGQSKRDAS